MSDPTAQAELLDLGRYRLAYTAGGEGSPTVVFEAGGGCTQESWARVFGPIAHITRALSYDRASLGKSDAGPRRRSCRDMVADLRGLLSAAGIAGPYILVGHSFGGQIVRLFAHLYPHDVAGMVLVDGVHHEQNTQALALMPPASPADSPRLASWRAFLLDGYVDDARYDPEGIDMAQSDAQVRAAGDLGDLPLVVLTARNHGDPPDDLPAAFIRAYDRMFHEQQRGLARLSTRGVQIMAERSGHFIQTTSRIW